MENANTNSSNKTVGYRYLFKFSSGIKKEFDVKLNAKTLDFIPTGKRMKPEWTRLNYFRCKNCPLDEKRYAFCPVAVNLAGLIESFKNSASYEEVDISIKTRERNFSKKTTLQKGMSSLIGIYMVTSSCPVMERLKPMVRYHLPFATAEETTYRAMSMYLLGQYLLKRKGKKPDWELKKLVEAYRNIHLVNDGIAKRLLNASKKDANVNAVIILDIFAGSIPFSIETGFLDEVEYLFRSYFLDDEDSDL